MRHLVIYGAGGLARELAELAAREFPDNDVIFHGFIVTDTTKLTDRDSTEEVAGD